MTLFRNRKALDAPTPASPAGDPQLDSLMAFCRAGTETYRREAAGRATAQSMITQLRNA